MKKILIPAALAFSALISCQKEAVLQSSDQPLITANSTGTTVNAATPQPVTITAVYTDFSAFPHVTGTFTTSGALTISGTTTMDIGPNKTGIRAHCVIVLKADAGTITIHQECEFASSPAKGQWQIASGTGAYANLKGNGSLLMPPNTEAMTGVIYE